MPIDNVMYDLKVDTVTNKIITIRQPNNVRDCQYNWK